MFQHYLDPKRSARERLANLMRFGAVACGDGITQALVFIRPLMIKHPETWEHSVRVALLARQIGEFVHLDGKALLYAGLLHDLGKIQTNPATLNKTEGWTHADTREVMRHVLDSYRIIRGIFDFSAEVILWHHKFQATSYPRRMPRLLHKYSLSTKILIPFYGRMLSLADTFDAFHRVNDKNGAVPLTGEQIKELMLERNRDLRKLVCDLYVARIFTTDIFTVS